MKTIYKYQLVTQVSEVELPTGAIPLHAAFQDEILYVWCRVNTEIPISKYVFYVVGTGWDLNDKLQYINTVHANGLVWHICWAKE